MAMKINFLTQRPQNINWPTESNSLFTFEERIGVICFIS